MSDAQEFLASRPILAYQLDATHLQSVLNHLCKTTDHLTADARQHRERDGALERALQDLGDRIARIETALLHLGGPEELRVLKAQVGEVSRVVDGLTAQVLPEMQRKLNEAQGAVDRAVKNAVEPVERRANEVLQQARMEMEQAVGEQRALSLQLKQDRDRQEQVFRERGLGASKQLEDAVANLDRRVDHVERNMVAPMRDVLTELQSACNDNFTQLGNVNVQFENEIKRLRGEVANLRSDVNQLDNSVASSISKIKEDIDTKFELLRQAMSSFERNNQLFEQAIAEAGARMSAARANATAAGLAQFQQNRPVAAAGTPYGR